MAYADTIRTTNPTFENVANLIDGQLITWQTVELTSATAYTASAAVTGASITVSVATGESVLVCYDATLSHSSATQPLDLSIRMDGVQLGTAKGYSYSTRAATDGLDVSVSYHHIHSPAAGSRTYSLYFAVAGATGYTRFIRFSTLKFRNS